MPTPPIDLYLLPSVAAMSLLIPSPVSATLMRTFNSREPVAAASEAMPDWASPGFVDPFLTEGKGDGVEAE